MDAKKITHERDEARPQKTSPAARSRRRTGATKTTANERSEMTAAFVKIVPKSHGMMVEKTMVITSIAVCKTYARR